MALHPVTLEQGGFETALGAVARQAARQGGFNVELDIDPQARRHRRRAAAGDRARAAHQRRASCEGRGGHRQTCESATTRSSSRSPTTAAGSRPAAARRRSPRVTSASPRSTSGCARSTAASPSRARRQGTRALARLPLARRSSPAARLERGLASLGGWRDRAAVDASGHGARRDHRREPAARASPPAAWSSRRGGVGEGGCGEVVATPDGGVDAGAGPAPLGLDDELARRPHPRRCRRPLGRRRRCPACRSRRRSGVVGELVRRRTSVTGVVAAGSLVGARRRPGSTGVAAAWSSAGAGCSSAAAGVTVTVAACASTLTCAPLGADMRDRGVAGDRGDPSWRGRRGWRSRCV